MTWSIGMGAQVYRRCNGRQVEVRTRIKSAEKLLRELCVSSPYCYIWGNQRGDINHLWHWNLFQSGGLGTSPGNAITLNSTAIGVGSARMAIVVRVA